MKPLKIVIETALLSFSERKRRLTRAWDEDRVVLSVESDERHDTLAKHMNHMADLLREIGVRGTP